MMLFRVCYFCGELSRMKLSRCLILLLMLVFAGCGNPAGETPVNKKTKNKKAPAEQKESLKKGLGHSYTFTKASKYQFDGLRCRIGDTLLMSSAKGKTSLADSSGKLSALLFDLNCEFLVDQMHVYPMKNKSWLVGWSETDHEGQKSHLAVFSPGKNKPDWIVTFPYMNIGPFVIDGDAAYFTTIGMVARINIEEGKVQWKIDSLFNSDNFRFNKFEMPLVYDDRVVFVDFPVPGRRDRRDTIVVDLQTGKRKK